MRTTLSDILDICGDKVLIVLLTPTDYNDSDTQYIFSGDPLYVPDHVMDVWEKLLRLPAIDIQPEHDMTDTDFLIITVINHNIITAGECDRMWESSKYHYKERS